MVKWSADLSSTPTIRVRIPLTPSSFSVKFVFEKNENKQKEAGVGPFLKREDGFFTSPALISAFSVANSLLSQELKLCFSDTKFSKT